MTTKRLALGAVAAALLLCGCPLTDLPEPPKPECSHASDCPEGKLCGPAGVCVDECRGDRDCPRGMTCNAGVCQAAPGTCGRDGDCAAGQVCAVNGKCVKPCATTAECGPGFTCLGGACLSSAGGCGRDVECGPSEVCAADGACTTACTTDAQCTAAQQCAAGACVTRQKSCAQASECSGAETCSPAGRCQVACTALSQCPNGQACASGHCAWLPATCGQAADCPASETCGAAMTCTDRCLSSRDCKDGLTCANGACAPPAPSCVTAAECGTGRACSPGGSCVTACTAPTDCSGSDECSAGACVPTGAAWAKLTGSVALTGVSDASGIPVRLRSSNAAVAVSTGADGTWSAAGLPAGRYAVVIDAPSVREGLVELDVAAAGGATTPLPPTTLTPVGTVTGKVTLQGASNHQGTQVTVVGGNAGATTDAAGDFTVRSVPAGTFQLAAAAAGYAASTANGVVVQWNQTTAVPPFSLSPLPVSNNTTFAFLSVPPATATARASWVYTAVAGGGGVTNPTYAVVDGPAGFSIDGATGVVTWAPQASAAGATYYVTLSARGGGMTVFQIFLVTVAPATPPRFAVDTWRLSQAPDASWTWDGDRGLSALGAAADGGSLDFTVGRDRVTFTPTQLELLNGSALTGFGSVASTGTFTGARGPFGTSSASFAGGAVGSVTSSSPFTLAAAPALRRVGAVAVRDGLTITQAVATTWPVTAVSGLSPLTGVTIDTGVATAVSDTVLTDSAANWTANLTGRCLLSAAGTVAVGITGNTTTTITTAGGLLAALAAGSRYFVGNCTGGSTTVVFTDSAASFGAIAGSRADLYLGPYGIGNCTILASPAPTATSFACTFAVSRYAELAQLATSGRYGIGTASGVPVTLTSAGASFAAGLSSTHRLQVEPSTSTPVAIVSNTATTITFRPTLGQAANYVPGQAIRLATLAYPYTSDVAVTFTGTALSGSRVGELLFLDVAGDTYDVTANTASTVTVSAPYWAWPLNDWAGSYGAVDPVEPRLLLTDTVGGLPPLLGHRLVRPRPSVLSWGAISAATATQVTVDLGTGGSVIRNALTEFAVGREWSTAAAGTSGYAQLELRLAGTPNLPPDGLVGRRVTLEKSPSLSGLVRANGAASLTVELTSSQLTAFLAGQAGDRLLLGDALGDFVVTVSDSSAVWTPGAYVGQWLVAGNSSAGFVRANTATTVEVQLNDSAQLANLAPGARFAFAPTSQQECGSQAGYVRATTTLAGATLLAGGYATLENAQGWSFRVLSNGTSSLLVGVCPSGFAAFVNGQGQRAVALPGTGVVPVFLDDSAASLTPGAAAGRTLALLDQGTLTPAVAANTATSFELALSWSQLFNLAPWSLVGRRYAVTEADGQLLFTLQGTFSPAAGSLTNRFVSLVADDFNASRGYLVENNTASGVTVRIPPSELAAITTNSQLDYGWLTWGDGVVVRYTVPNAGWQPGELVGHRLYASGSSLDIVANTGTTLTVAVSGLSSSTMSDVFGLSSMTLYEAAIGGLAALPGGDALVAYEQWSTTATPLVRYGRNGLVARYAYADQANALTLSPLPVFRGVTTAATTTGGVTTLTVAGASWTPGEHRGAVVRTRAIGTLSWLTAQVVDNTANTLTLLESAGSAGRELVVEPMRFTVSGAVLTPGALAGQSLMVNGRVHRVRGNTASEVTLYPNQSDDESPGPAAVAGTQAIRLDRTRGAEIAGTSGDGAAGAWLAAADGLWRFDGTGFTFYDEVATAPALGSGTIASVTVSSLTDTAATFTPDALIGARVRLARGIYTVSGNTDRTLFFGNSFPSGVLEAPPLPGEAYALSTADGVVQARSVSATGTALWVGSTAGLHQRQGSTWTRHTVASTESVLGRADGLASNVVAGVHAVSATEAWAWYASSLGVSHVSGSTWRRLTVANTESAPGRADGLPRDFVYDVRTRGADVFLATGGGGAVKLNGATWTHYDSTLHQAFTWVYALGFGPTGLVWLGTASGVYEVTP